MFGLKQWLTGLLRNKQFEARLQALENSLIVAEKAYGHIQDELFKAKNELEVFREKEAKDAARYDSKDPWVEIKSADFNEARGFRIDLDWNDAFIQHLKENGIKGSNDEEIVQKWLAFLYHDLVSKLEEQVIDKKDATKEQTISDFV